MAGSPLRLIAFGLLALWLVTSDGARKGGNAGAQPTPAGPPLGPPGQPPGPPRCTGIANWDVMVAQNPNIAVQIDRWKVTVSPDRRADWNAFRAHVLDLGAPDPGPSPPAYFCQRAVG